ncbi:MAG: tetratricopeptide repeat protein [Elusimicrobiales bacterium]|nr:tetratricopeptide repeat protein [Elusimicrobiales bacterium]
MKYLLISLLFAAAVPAAAQTAPAGADKDIRLQTPAELAQTATSLEQSLIMQPENVELHLKLGFTYTRLGRADEAQRSFETATRLDPKRAIAHYMLGLIYEKKGLKAKAMASWQACLENTADPHMRETALKHLNTLNAR